MALVNVVIDKAQKCNGEYSLYLTFEYDSLVIDVIRDMPTRWWNPEAKTWEIPVNKLPVLLQKLPTHQFNISGKYIETEKKAVKAPKEFKFKTKPFEHQLDAFQYGLDNDKWLLGDEMGLGKTKQSIDIAIAKKLERGYKHCLIICGVNGLKWNWKQEILVHSNETGYILGQRGNKIGSNADKLEDVIGLEHNDNYFIITNVESLRNNDICEALATRCKNGLINMIVFDEIHKCFDYNTPIKTDKGYLKIGDIVTNHLDVNVASFNEISNKIEYKPIINWYENGIYENLLELTIQTNSGIRHIKCTDTHKFYTRNRGWICAKDLTEEDDLVEFDL